MFKILSGELGMKQLSRWVGKAATASLTSPAGGRRQVLIQHEDKVLAVALAAGLRGSQAAPQCTAPTVLLAEAGRVTAKARQG